MSSKSADYWIDYLQLKPHPEGGFFREIYRSDGKIKKDALPAEFTGDRSFCTSIYFLLKKYQRSVLHRIKSDELWHFYTGSPLTVFEINKNAELIKHKLGNDTQQNNKLFTVVKAGSWFGAALTGEGDYSLVGCTVSPGFDFADFEMADKENLLLQYPRHKDVIEMLG